MKRASFFLTLCAVGLAAVAFADAIQKWRTPSGSLYFGDHPPPGSTLLETYAETPTSSPVTVIPGTETASFSQAAADGREIIRRREEERAAERRADAERDARNAEIEARQQSYDEPFWFITSTVLPPCRAGERCFERHRHHHDHDRFSVVDDGRPPRFLADAAPRPPLRPLPQRSSPPARGSRFGDFTR
jgi:hypothetical protein